MNKVMVDLETLSLANNPVILSIGAARFDKDGIQATFHEKIAITSCTEAGLDICDETVAWWQKQEADLRAEVMSGTKSLKNVLELFTIWLGENPTIWGNGATADNVWLKSAYEAVGLEAPWQYHANRCYRTAMAMFPPRRWTKPVVAHDALEDAKAQAYNLLNSMATHGYEAL